MAIRNLVRSQGHRCSVVNLTRFRRISHDDVFYPRSAGGVLRLLLKLRPDILHLHVGGTMFPRVLALAFICTLWPYAKTVLTLHSGRYSTREEGQSARYLTLRGLVFRRLDRIIAVNQELARLFQGFGVAHHRIRCIVPYAAPGAVPNGQLPESLSRFLAAHHPVLISVGQLEAEYDLPLQIGALGDLHKRFPNAGLIIAGSGSLESELTSTVRSVPQGAHVYLYGDMPHQVTLQTIARSDALLRTTCYDGDSVAIREALHLGTPVVATDNGMRPPGVRLIPMNDRQALCAAIEECVALGRKPASLPPVDDNLQQVLDLYKELSTVSPGRSFPTDWL